MYLAYFVGYTEHAMRSTPTNVAVKRYFEWILNSTFDLQLLECFDTLPRRLDLWQVRELSFKDYQLERTLIAIVRIAAITSKEPFSTRLSGREGSYSQMAVDVSTAAIFVIWVITSTSARLTT